MSAPWGISYAEAMKQAAHDDIPRDDADRMWTKYQEIGDAVRAREITDEAGLAQFGQFCRQLASERAIRTLFSPRLDVITGKLR